MADPNHRFTDEGIVVDSALKDMMAEAVGAGDTKSLDAAILRAREAIIDEAVEQGVKYAESLGRTVTEQQRDTLHEEIDQTVTAARRPLFETDLLDQLAEDVQRVLISPKTK